MKTKNQNPIGFGQLCVIAKEQRQGDGAISRAEWSARIKDRLVRLRLPYPAYPHDITAAMNAVERAMRATR
jgi:hypothetical protein